MRHILEEAVLPADWLRMGSTLAALSREVGLTNADFEVLRQIRDQKSAGPMISE